MRVDICKWKCADSALFCIETDRNSLNGSDIVDRTLLVKVCECDVTRGFIDVDRRDRRRNLLNQRQMLFTVKIIWCG